MQQLDSDFSDDDNDNVAEIDEMSVLVMGITGHSILLSKSQVPEVKERKKKATMEVIESIFKKTGRRYESKVLQKKISNMKARVKAKTDRNKTGNRKVKLLDWEDKLLKLMDQDENPVFMKVKGKPVKQYVSVIFP